jgi:hypothetical protein
VTIITRSRPFLAKIGWQIFWRSSEGHMTDLIWRSRAARALRLAETLAEGDARLLRAYADECDAEARRLAVSLASALRAEGRPIL